MSIGISSDVSQIIVGILLILTVTSKIIISKIRLIMLNNKILNKVI